MIAREPRVTKVLYAFVLITSTAILSLAAHLAPSGRGYGTHQQLGLPPCSFPATIGLPCPSCGWTTAFAHVAHLEIVQAFAAQPFGALLCLGTAFAGALAFTGLVFHARVWSWVERWPWPRIAAWGIFLMLASWAYKAAVMMRQG